MPAQIVYDIARPSDDPWGLASGSIVYRRVQKELRDAGYGVTKPMRGTVRAPMPRGAERRFAASTLRTTSADPPVVQVVTSARRARPDHPRIVTAAELAAIMKLSRPTIYEYAKSGKIPVVPLGRPKRFDLDDVLDHLEERARDPWARTTRPLRTVRRPRLGTRRGLARFVDVDSSSV